MPVVLVAELLKDPSIDLFGQGLGFLQAQNIGVGSAQPIGKTLLIAARMPLTL